MKKRFIITAIIETDDKKISERDIFEGIKSTVEEEGLSMKLTLVQDVTQILK